MKRLLALLAGGLGLKVLLKRRSGRTTGSSPADELREKLAQAKAQEPAPPPTVDGRRADVHAQARQAIDDLREP